MTTAHSPLPKLFYCSDTNTICFKQKNGEDAGVAELHAWPVDCTSFGEPIVRRCNAHDAMREALEEATKFFEKSAIKFPGMDGWLEQAKAALALASGTQEEIK